MLGTKFHKAHLAFYHLINGILRGEVVLENHHFLHYSINTDVTSNPGLWKNMPRPYYNGLVKKENNFKKPSLF